MRQIDMSPEGLGFTSGDLGVSLGRKALAEFIAVMIFVFIGCGAVVALVNISGADSNAALLGIAIAHGLAIATMVAATARISGGHVNPAVTVSMIVTGRIKLGPGLIYIVAQMLGAVAGAAILSCVLVDSVEGNLGAQALNDANLDSTLAGLITETFLTFVLVFTVFACAVDRRGLGNVAPLAIGFAVLIDHFIGVPLTGASMNPARTFGPALVANEWDDFWLYVIGPCLGAIIAGLVYAFIYLDRPDEEPEPEYETPE